MTRSAVAVIAGLLAMTLVVMFGTMAATALLVPGGVRAIQGQGALPAALPASYLAVNLVISLGAAVLGGWLAARLAASAPLAHTLALAVVVALMSIPFVLQPQPGQPAWYGWVVAALGIGGVLFGGRLRMQRLAASSQLA